MRLVTIKKTISVDLVTLYCKILIEMEYTIRLKEKIFCCVQFFN